MIVVACSLSQSRVVSPLDLAVEARGPHADEARSSSSMQLAAQEEDAAQQRRGLSTAKVKNERAAAQRLGVKASHL